MLVLVDVEVMEVEQTEVIRLMHALQAVQNAEVVRADCRRRVVERRERRESFLKRRKRLIASKTTNVRRTKTSERGEGGWGGEAGRG